jgi:hypothetical protein
MKQLRSGLAIRCSICEWCGPVHFAFRPHWTEARKHINAEHGDAWNVGPFPIYRTVTLVETIDGTFVETADLP